MEYQYTDMYRAEIAVNALLIVQKIFDALADKNLTHRDRNHIEETIKLVVGAAIEQATKQRVDVNGIPF